MIQYWTIRSLAGSQSYFLQSSHPARLCIEGLEAERTLSGHHWERCRGGLGEVNDHLLIVETPSIASYLMVGEIWTLHEMRCEIL